MKQAVESQILNEDEMAQARAYCLYHSLSRPDTSLITGLKWLIGLELLTITFAWMTHYLLCRFELSVSFYLIYSLTSFLVFLVSLKKMCIIAIEMYQRYASEAIRRRCSLMPSCSEYALITLTKNNAFKGLYKIIIRLANKCNGIYKIDYP